MTDSTAPALLDSLASRFPSGVRREDRPGFDGHIVEASHLLDFARAVRDELGYNYLSSVTGVDYPAEGVLESVYHASRTSGGPALVFKVRVPRDNPVVPSMVGLYPGAELQEREAYDLLGIRFDGHPDLRRILTWDGFYGHPLRKDWQEAYFDEETKPFKARWPEGRVYRVEDKTPYHHNVKYPAGWTPEGWVPEGDKALYAVLGKVQGGDGASGAGLDTDEIVVNLGPQHPSTHGVFRMVVRLDGETIVGLKPVMGYLHRNHEKIGERNTFVMNMPFTDRLDYFCSMSNNFGYALAVEKLMGVRPTERADYIRVLMAELTRIVNHLLLIGFMLNDLGAYYTPFMYCFDERELILDLFEMVSGSRMMCNYFRFGGVARDLPEGAFERARELVFERLPRKIDELDRFLTASEIVRNRCIGVGVLPRERAIACSASGPLLRASGVPYDVRRADPYSIYDRLEFDVCVREHGDVYDRFMIRFDEMRQSLRILQQVVRDMPGGPIQSRQLQYQVRVPAGESYGHVEGPKGELGYYLVSNGKPNPWRYHVRAPSFINLTALEGMCMGNKVADVVITLGSIDIVLGEVDR